MNRFALLFSFLILTFSTAVAQKADVAFVVGGSSASDAKVNSPCPPFAICIDSFLTEKIRTGHQFYWEAAGAYRVADFKVASFYVELPVARVPSQRLTFAGGFTVGHLTSTFVTPSFKVKLLPKAPPSPFATVGGGGHAMQLTSAPQTRALFSLAGD